MTIKRKGRYPSFIGFIFLCFKKMLRSERNEKTIIIRTAYPKASTIALNEILMNRIHVVSYSFLNFTSV